MYILRWASLTTVLILSVIRARIAKLTANLTANPFEAVTTVTVQIVVLLVGSVAYGVYSTFGSGSKELRDTIDEHAKMHELGIAHGHGGSSEAYEMSGKLQKDNISWKLNNFPPPAVEF